VSFLWFYCVYSRFEYVQDLCDTDFKYRTDVPDSNSPDKHDFDQVNHPGAAALVGYVLVADKLASAIFAGQSPGDEGDPDLCAERKRADQIRRAYKSLFTG
jgi:hypothetical protein